MINPFSLCSSFSTIALIRLIAKEKKLFREIINSILRQFLAKHFGVQLLHVQIFSDRPCHNIFSQKLTIYFGFIFDEGCIMEHSCIFSNRYCVYVLMEQFMFVLVDMEVVNKTETKGVSTYTEREELRLFFLRHEEGLDISELVTDASFVIQKFIKDLKSIHSFNLFRYVLI